MKHSEVHIDVYAFGLPCSLLQSQKNSRGSFMDLKERPPPPKQPKSSVNCSYDERNVVQKTSMCAKLLSLLTDHNVIFSFILIISTCKIKYTKGPSIMKILVPISPQWHETSFWHFCNSPRTHNRMCQDKVSGRIGGNIEYTTSRRWFHPASSEPRRIAHLHSGCLTGLNFSSKINAEGADERPCRYPLNPA